MILSINFAILTFFKFFLSNFLKHFRVVGMKIFLFFFWKAKKNCRFGTKKTGLVGLAETQELFLDLKSRYPPDIPGPIGAVVTKD